MLKKSLIILSVIFAVLFISTFTFAVTTNDVKNGVTNVTNTVVDGTANLASDVRNGIGNAENGIEGAVRDMGDSNNVNTDNSKIMDNANNGYTASRTSTGMTTQTNTGFGNTTLWTWLILAAIGIVIVALVWYYGTQNIDTNTRH